MTPNALLEKMAENNRKNWADVGNAFDVHRQLSIILMESCDSEQPGQKWLTPAVVEASGKAALALADQAYEYAADLEDRLAKSNLEGLRP